MGFFFILNKYFVDGYKKQSIKIKPMFAWDFLLVMMCSYLEGDCNRLSYYFPCIDINHVIGDLHNFILGVADVNHRDVNFVCHFF